MNVLKWVSGSLVQNDIRNILRIPNLSYILSLEV